MNKGVWIERKDAADYFLPPLAIVRKVWKNFVIATAFAHKNRNGNPKMFAVDHVILNADMKNYYRPLGIQRETEEKPSPEAREEAKDVLNRQLRRVIVKNKFIEYLELPDNIFINPRGVQQRIF